MYATISQILYPNRLGLVGTPDQVAERIDEFEEAGVDLLLLQCSPQLEEMERFAAEVIRKVHPIRNISV
ncbi:MAG: dimethylsulfone monooxygenase [Verrucomicrobiota bacterium]|jgi:FMNH2-dependent dimethyl sulfone monooxygenase